LVTLLPAPLACCRWELERRHLTPPSNFALRIIVEEDRKLVRRLNAIYVNAARDGGLDNAESDASLDVLGKHFTGRPWPRSGGLDATRHFMANLQPRHGRRRMEGRSLRSHNVGLIDHQQCGQHAESATQHHLHDAWIIRRFILVIVPISIGGCYSHRPDFMVRVQEDCVAGDQWACGLLDSLSHRMPKDEINRAAN
jgi:hypothetical protein